MATQIIHESLTLPTYETAPENTNPCFNKRLGAHVYPYRLQDKLTGNRTEVSHDAVVLENEYIRLTFLPDFGCRLYSAYDKLLNREIFYRNDCIKPALIATRGAWISGGVEFNFPVSHSVYTHSRIPYTTRQNKDGSASFIFGLTEQMTGMRFTVEVTLVPGEYRFSEKIRLYNGTTLPHRHYWWTNAGVYLTPETQMIYPLHLGISGLYGDRTPWPVCEGVDLSWAMNHKQAGDIFASETYDEFFGVYHWDKGCGVAHWAKQEEMPARKMFFWGADEMGERWQRMLTENAGDYLEIQAGRFATQGDFDMLMPHETVEMTEYWIPVGKTDGYVKATPEGVISVVPVGSKSRIAVQLNTSHELVKLLISDAGRVDQKIERSFDAGQVCWFESEIPASTACVTVMDESGAVLLLHDPESKNQRHDVVPRTCVMPKQTENPDDVLQAARVHERMDSAASSIAMYDRLIGTEHESEARKALARFALKAGRQDEAETHARFVWESDGDTEAAYLLGLALDDDANRLQSFFFIALDDSKYGRSAAHRLSESELRKGDYHATQEWIDGKDDLLACMLRFVAGRKDFYEGGSWNIGGQDELMDRDPLSRLILWERHFLDLDDAAEEQRECSEEANLHFVGHDIITKAHPEWFREDVNAAVRYWNSETLDRTSAIIMQPEHFQEDICAATWYWKLGMNDEARTIIRAWAEMYAPTDPCFDALAERLGIALPDNRTDPQGIATCFAHGDVLLNLVKDSNLLSMRLHLGNLLYARGRTDEAIEAWETANDDSGMASRHLALAYWQRKGDIEAAYRHMRAAHEADRDNSDTLATLDMIAEHARKYDVREEIADRILKFAPDDSRCIERAVRIFIESGRLDEAVELITTKRFFVAELAYQTRVLYVRALLLRGSKRFEQSDFAGAADDFQLSTEYPENLGVGRVRGGSDAQAFYLLGLALDKLGHNDEAVQAWTSAASDEPVHASGQAYYVGMARRRIDRDDADEAFERLADLPPSDGTDHKDARLHYLRGLSSLASGDTQKSIEHFIEAHRIESADPVELHNYLEHLSLTHSHGRRMPIPVWWTIEPLRPKTGIV